MHIFPFACIRFIFAVKRQSQISKWIVHYTYESIVQCMGIKFFFFIFCLHHFSLVFIVFFSIEKNCWITFISFFLIYGSEGDTIAYNYVVAFSEKIVFLFFCCYFVWIAPHFILMFALHICIKKSKQPKKFKMLKNRIEHEPLAFRANEN